MVRLSLSHCLPGPQHGNLAGTTDGRKFHSVLINHYFAMNERQSGRSDKSRENITTPTLHYNDLSQSARDK